MNFINAVIPLLFVLIIDSVVTQPDDDRSRCPPPEDIKPCTCDGRNIRCFSTIEFDLEQTFKALGMGRSEEDKSWDTLEMSTPLIFELKDSVFHGVTFRTVKFLHCTKLNCVSPTAFYGMERALENFVGYGTTFSHGDRPGCNLFDALRRLRGLRAINITESRIREIPDDAFHETSGHHNYLTHIDMSNNQGGEITRIGRNAFTSLKALKFIDVSSHQISRVDSHAFYFEEPSNDYLTINLENNLLTSESIDVDAFAINGRITTVKLGGNPNLLILRDSVFRSFLINTGRSNPNEQNIVDLRGSPLACTRANLWLLENKFKLHRKIVHLISADSGIEFWRHTPGQCDK